MPSLVPRADEPARELMGSLLQRLSTIEPCEFETWLNTESTGLCEDTDGARTYPLFETIMRAVQLTAGEFVESILKLVAPEISERWCELQAVDALSPARFATLVAYVPPGSISEAHLGDVILSYIDRRKMAFDGEVAHALIRFVDMQFLPRGYIAANLAPRMSAVAGTRRFHNLCCCTTCVLRGRDRAPDAVLFTRGQWLVLIAAFEQSGRLLDMVDSHDRTVASL